MGFGDLAQALAILAVAVDGGVVELQRITADVLAFQDGRAACRRAPVR